MKTKLLFASLFLFLAAACGTEGQFDRSYDPSTPPENLGTPCDTVLQNGEYVIFCNGVQLNVDSPGYSVRCYYKIEEDGSKTVRCNTGTEVVFGGGGC